MKKIIEITKKYFTIWWIPIGIYLIAINIFLSGTLFKRNWIIDFSLILFYVNILGTIISSIVLIWIRKWYFSLFQLGITIFLFFYTSIISLSLPDYYGVGKKIPNGVIINEPLNERPSKDQFNKFDLILSYSVQPGIYNYYTDYQSQENGYFYIKAFELSTNERLSADRIIESSKIKFEKLKQTEYQGEFTIYEGSWGDKYGSRIELWFQSSDGKREYKITERNYIVEGWMR